MAHCRFEAGLFFLVALQWLSVALASHFRYGTISWAPVNSYSNTMRFTFRLAFRRSFSSSYDCDLYIISSGSLLGSGDSWRAECVNYPGYSSQCNSVIIGSTGFRCTDYSNSEDWSMGENNFTHTFSSIHDEWIVSYSSCCWISLTRYGGGSWLVSTTVNLTRRSDNGRINSSPVSRSPAIVRWHEGCPQSLRIPVEDADGDVVKCRLATYSESYVYSDSFPYGTLDEKSCLLTYNGTSGTTGTYAVALTIEDFPEGTTNFDGVIPFSAVGLQFLVIISSHSGSCNNVPVFTPLTPQDGECTEVQIGSLYRAVIEVTLADFSKHVVEVVTSSPPGMQITSLRYNGGVYYRNVTWYPSQYQVGQQSFCFKAVDSSGMGSQWRCITILVGISSTPRVILGRQTPQTPLSASGLGYIWWSIQFDRVIKKPRTSSYIRLVLLPSGHTVYKVDTLSQFAIINSDLTTLWFAMPYAALSMNGSYAILMDRGAVVGQGCSYDGPPTPGITNTSDWQFITAFCPVGYALASPDFTTCLDINECGSHSRMKRSMQEFSSVSQSVWPSLRLSASISKSGSPSLSISTTVSTSQSLAGSVSSISSSLSASTSKSVSPSVFVSTTVSASQIVSESVSPSTSISISSISPVTSATVSASRGTSASFSIWESQGVSPHASQSVSFDPGSCGTHIYAPSYTHFHSPGYPDCYPNNVVCTWLIEAPPGFYIQLHIYHFNLEYEGNHCPWDYLEIYDGQTMSSSLITKACGSLGTFDLYSSGRFLFVRFHSDTIIPRSGFSAWCSVTNHNYNNSVPSQLASSSSSASCSSMNMFTQATWVTAKLQSTSASVLTSQTLFISKSLSTSVSPSISSSTSGSASTSGSVLVSPSYSASISPSISASVSGYYAPFSLNALPTPVDFQYHVPADCEQICTNTQGSYSCSCVSGYQLSSDGKSCVDIDECLTNNGGCSHNCYNIPGSFYCGCPERTTRLSNNLTCVEPGATVACDENNMTISLEKQTFPFFDASNLHLRYSSCRATQNSTHVSISTTLNACGTLVNETEDELIFWNEIRVDAVIIDNVITRTHDINLRFYCSYSRKKMLSIQFRPQQIFIGSEAGYGNFTFKMDFYKTAAFATPYTENDYPISIPLNEFLYVKYSVESSADLVIMAENCRTTKTAYFFSLPQYTVIQDGCPQDTTMEYTYYPTANSQQFKMRSFRFFNDYDVVYFHCELLACYRYSYNSRCSGGCLTSKKRKKREIGDKLEHDESTNKYILTSGPIKIAEKSTEGGTGQSQNIAFIGGAAAGGGVALIAIIALAVLAVKYRLARKFMNRNKVGDLYAAKDEQMSRRNAYIQEDDMIEKEDAF